MIVALILAGCGSAPAPRDPSSDASYRKDVEQLASMARQANQDYQSGRANAASDAIEKAQQIEKRVLAVPHTTIEAAEAASDLDDLYGRMLLANHHYGWAQMMFQKNLSRWKHWEPQSEESARRVKQAESEIAECSRKIDQ